MKWNARRAAIASTSTGCTRAVQRLVATGWRISAVRVIFFVVIWWVLTGGAPNSWLLGAPLVIVAAAASQYLSASSNVRVRMVGILWFIPFFLWGSLRGGMTTAALGLWRARNMRPLTVEHVTTLPSGPAKAVFAGVIGLMPGTLVVEIEDDRLQVHVLDECIPVLSDLKELERRVAAIFVSANQKWS